MGTLLKLSFIAFLSLALAACGKGLSTKEYEKAYKDKLEGTPATADSVQPKEEVPLSEYYEPVGDFAKLKTSENIAERFQLTDEPEPQPGAEPTTQAPEDKETHVRIVKGSLDIKDLKHSFNASEKKMTITGEVAFKIKDSKEPEIIPFVMSGELNSANSITLVPEQGRESFKNSFKAIAFCSSETCEEFYVNFYYWDAANKYLYTQQVVPRSLVVAPKVETKPAPKETQKETSKENSKDKPKETPKETPKENPKEDTPNKTSAPQANDSDKSSADKTADDDSEEGDEGDEHLDPSQFQPGEYVGPSNSQVIDIFPDLKVLKVKAEESRKKNTPPPQQAPKQQSPAPKQDSKPQPVAPGEVRALWPDSELPEPIKNLLESKLLRVGVNQANGYPSSGKLVNGVELTPLLSNLSVPTGIRILEPERHYKFGTSELISTIIKIGQWVVKHVPSFEVDVRNISKPKGGRLDGSASHQNGTDADIGYIFKQTNHSSLLQKVTQGSKPREDFQIDKNWQLFKALLMTNQVEFILVSPTVKAALCKYAQETQEIIKPETAETTKQYLRRISDRIAQHDNHFHIRVACGPEQHFCKRLSLTPNQRDECRLK
jgi:hypothetical protein